LYLAAPEGQPLDVLGPLLSEALSANDVAAVLYANADKASPEHASTLMQCALDHEAAFIVADDIAFARQIGADGVQVSGDIETYERARNELGDDRIVGLTTALNRHDSMCLGEVGTNYILFDADLPNPHPSNAPQSLESLIDWWSGLFEIPCVAPVCADVDKTRALIDAGVDFLFLDATIWNCDQNADITLKSISGLIADCGRKQ
jgi:thiamine-phosphate pyrophosphorylase